MTGAGKHVPGPSLDLEPTVGWMKSEPVPQAAVPPRTDDAGGKGGRRQHSRVLHCGKEIVDLVLDRIRKIADMVSSRDS